MEIHNTLFLLGVNTLVFGCIILWYYRLLCEFCVFFCDHLFYLHYVTLQIHVLLHIEFTYVLARLCWSQCSFLRILKRCPHFFLDTQLDEGWSFFREKHITSLFVVTFRKVDFVFTPLSIYLSKHEHLGFRKGWDRSLLKKSTGYRRVFCLGWKVSISVGESVRNHRTEMDLKDAMTLKLFAVRLGHWK